MTPRKGEGIVDDNSRWADYFNDFPPSLPGLTIKRL